MSNALECVSILNDESATSKAKLAALATLAELARADPIGVLEVFDGVEAAFEQLLFDKEDAHKKFGTALGRFHETTTLILLRATRYSV